jgi:hypothetical protein
MNIYVRTVEVPLYEVLDNIDLPKKYVTAIMVNDSIEATLIHGDTFAINELAKQIGLRSLERYKVSGFHIKAYYNGKEIKSKGK